MKPVILSALLVMLAVNRVSIKVDRTVLFAGNGITITCTVPRHPDNRMVAAVLVGYTSSEHQLDGEASPITHRFPFKSVSCDTIEARCELHDKFGGTAIQNQSLEIQGCEP